MLTSHYVGLDIHKKTISFCVRQSDGTILQEGTVAANCEALDEWLPRIPQPWVAGMEATMFTGWVYDHLLQYSAQVKVAHPAMLKAISAGKKKNDRVDAQKISDLLRCNYFPECHIASREIRDRRRVLRYRNLIVRQSVQMKNRVGSMLMETGILYNKQKLHQRRYFSQLLRDQANAMPNSMPELLRLSRLTIDGLGQMNKQLLQALHTDQVLADRVQRLMTIPGVGQVLSLTWALEMGDITRFRSVKDAISYCGLCGAEQSSGGKTQRSPISKQRNKHLQTTLIEAAKVATRWHPELALLYEREKQKANRNRGTLAVARKIVAYLLAVDRSKRNFEPRHEMPISAQG
jgi:transposase